MAKRRTNRDKPTARPKTRIRRPIQAVSPEVPQIDLPVEEKPIVSDESIRNAKLLAEELSKSQEILKGITDLDSVGIENYADKLQLSIKLQENSEQIATVMALIEDYSKKNVENAEYLVDSYSSQVSLLNTVRDKLVESVVNSKSILDDSFQIVDLSDELNEYAKQRNELETIRGDLSKEDYDRQTKLLDLVKDRLDALDSINKSQETANKLATNYLKSNTLLGLSTKNLLHSLEEFREEVGTGSLGVVGEFLGNKASHMIEKISEDIEHKIVLAFQNSGEAAVSSFGMAKIALGSFVKYAIPALGILGVLGIFGELVHLAGHLDEELSEIGKTLGISRHEAEQFHHVAKDIAGEMKIVGINSKEVGESMMSLAGMLGGLSITTRMKEGSEATKQLVQDVSVLQNSFGLAADEAGGIASISEFSIIMGKSMGQVVKESLKLGKGLLTTKASIAIVGKIAPNIAIAFKKGSVELLKAAQRAKLLGIELEDVADFGDKILDFESSLEAEMTARVITGRKINFDMARQYALAGDISGLQEEMLNQLGSMNAFQSMNRLQQKYMAEAFGMTVDEVAKLLAAQERLNELGIDQTKMDQIQSMNAKELTAEMQNTNNEKLKGYLQTLAKEKESAAINERISDFMQKIKEKIAGSLAPLLEMVHHFLDSAEGAEFLQSMVDGVTSLVKGLVPIVKFLGEHIWILGAALGAFVGVKMIRGASTVIGLFKGIGGAAAASKPAVDAVGGAFGDLSQQMGTTTQAGNALNQSMGGTSGTVGSFVSSLSKTAVNMAIVGVAMIAFAGALWITAKAFQEFGKVDWKNAWPGIGVMIALAAAAWALAASVEGMGIAAAGVGLLSLALLSFGAAVLMIGKGTKLFSDAVGGIADGINKFKDIGDISEVSEKIKEVISAVSSINTQIDPSKTAKMRDAIANLGIDQLVEFGKLAKVDLGKAAQNVIEGIRSLANIKVDEELNFGNAESFFSPAKGKGVIGALQKLDEAIGQLELENIQSLSTLATTDMTKLGENISKGIDSLKKINVGDAVSNLANVKEVFASLRSALANEGLFGTYSSYLEPLKDLESLNMTKLVDNTFLLKDVIYNLSQIGKMGASGLENLATIFSNLSTALSGMDTEKLTQFSNINADNLAKIAAVFEEPQTVNVRTTTTGGSAVETEESKMNKKLDQVVAVLTNILGATNQPTYINIGGKTVEAIGLQIQGMKNRSLNINANGGVTLFG